MIRGDKNKGNRTPRYPQEVDSTICMVAKEHYLVAMSRWTLKHVTDDVNLQLHGKVVPSTNPPISIAYVKRIIMTKASTDPELERMLPTNAIAAKSIAKKRIRVEAPFERVEQDALHLPFVAKRRDGEVTSQIWWVHAIDCYSSYPLGWHLVVGSPTDRETLACAELYMAPLKKKRFEEIGVDHDMNVCGTPAQLIFDNGAEAKTARVQNLEKLGVDVNHCRARAGQEKPFIERLNRSLKEALEGLPGCTRMDGKDGQRDPVKLGDNLMTIEELERWIVRWYYEKWIHKPLKRFQWDAVLAGQAKGDTPAERWKFFEAGFGVVSLPPSRAEWFAALYEHKECRLSRKTGITVNGLNYKSDDMPKLIDQFGEHRMLHVLFNPDDFRHVYIYDGDDIPLVTLTFEFLRPENPAWSFKEAKERHKTHKSTKKPVPQADKFDRDLHEKIVSSSLEPKAKKPGKHERNRETARRDKEAKAIQRAAQRPLPVPPPVNTSKSTVTAGTQAATSSVLGTMLDHVKPLPILNRDTGELLK